MASLQGKTAVVIGATSGVGKATARVLASEGVRVAAVARGADGLEQLRTEIPEGLETYQADASDPTTAERLLRNLRPDLVVLAAGARPHMAPLDEQTWETFSEPWSSDTKAAFHLLKAAIRLPLREGSTVVVMSSGAAINGAPLSGGYAGAKRMQWLLAGYAQRLADAKNLRIRFLAVLPKQLIAGTKIGNNAADAYGGQQGISGAELLRRYDAQLDVDKVAAAVVAGLRGELEPNVRAIGVTGEGVESLT